jgi:hypothetical protein
MKTTLMIAAAILAAPQGAQDLIIGEPETFVRCYVDREREDPSQLDLQLDGHDPEVIVVCSITPEIQALAAEAEVVIPPPGVYVWAWTP